MMNLPLYHRPSALIFLDDDPSYLEMLAVVMPRSWCVRLFTHADDCIQHIRQEHALWEADLWAHHTMVANWRAGEALIPQLLHYWQTHTQRYALTGVYVVDYAMPAMTGLDVLQALPSWPENRVLLTGKADEIVAVTAFNQGLISRFIPKQRPDIGTYLTQVLAAQRACAMPQYEGVWRTTLRKEQYAKLQDRSVTVWLHKFLQEQQWLEYVVIAQPFGVLGLDAQAQPCWLQLELRDDLPAAAELAQSSGHTSEQVRNIKLGTHLSNAELLMALQNGAACTISTAFTVGDGSSLFGAIFNLPEVAPLPPSYSQFIAAQPPRSAADLS